MKIICQKDLLVEAVSNVSRAVCAKSPIPALEGILLKAEEGTLELTGYDLELGIVTTIEPKQSRRENWFFLPDFCWTSSDAFLEKRSASFPTNGFLPPSVAVHRNLPSPA